LIASTTMLAVLGAVGVAGARGGYPADRPRLLSGSAWLPSSQVGQLTLLDGSSAEVAAQVQVAKPGENLEAVQQGSTAYVVNRTTGTLRRVDGATFVATRPVSLIPGATDNLRAYAGPATLYALDAGRGVLAEADPGTLAGRGTPVSMAARLAAQSASIDDDGRLWVLDGESGNLDWVRDGQRHTRQHATASDGGLLTLADGRPVVVDPKTRTATVLDPLATGAGHRTDLDLRANDRIQVTGSPHAARLYVVASRGMLAVCELTESTCSRAVALGSGDADLGAAVENGGRVFVPDYTGGRVWIVDLNGLQVVAQPQVVPPGTRFQLLARDSLVFFNDPNSEHAGVIRLDGGIRRVAKYDPGNPGAGLTRGENGNLPGATSSSPPTNHPSTPPSTKPKPKTSTDPPTQPQPPQPGPQPQPQPQPSQTQPQPGPSSASPSSSPSPSQSTSLPPPPPPPPPPALQISASASPSEVDQDVVLAVRSTTAPQPVSAQWDFGDGGTANGLTVNHRWTSARTYQVSVTATFPDGQTNTASVSQRVDPPQPVKGTLRLNLTGPGKVTSNPAGINCPTKCTAQFVEGTQVTLTATPGPRNGDQFEEFGGDCPPAGDTCDLTITAAGANVDATFRHEISFNRLTLNITDPATGDGGGIVDVSDSTGSVMQCVDAQCTHDFVETETVTLEPNHEGDGVSVFVRWQGACNSTSQICKVNMSASRTVTSVWARCPAPGCPPGINANGAQQVPISSQPKGLSPAIRRRRIRYTTSNR
jgi:chitodextrinase